MNGINDSVILKNFLIHLFEDEKLDEMNEKLVNDLKILLILKEIERK